MDHEAIEELLGAYALDAVEPDEAARVDAHLATCSACREELDGHLEVTALLPRGPALAPPSVWESISQKIAPDPAAVAAVDAGPADLQEREIAGEFAAPSIFSIGRFFIRPVAVAAAFVLLMGASVVQSVRLSDANSRLSAERAAVVALTDQLEHPMLDAVARQAAGDPAARQVMLGSQVSGSNAIIVLMPDGTGYLAEHTLKPLPPDRTYQLWAIVEGRVISAGVLGPDPDVVPFHIDPAGFQGFAITEEVVGGVVSSENDPVVAWLAA